MVSAVLAAAAFLSSAPAGCPATLVRYEAEVPAVRGKPPSAGLVGSLPRYPTSLRDRRVNGSDGLVLWRRGAEVVWNTSGKLVARRLDGRGSFATDRVSLRFPSSGCWRLSVAGASVVAQVVEVPRRLACGATVLEQGDAFARPRTSGIRGGWPWQSTGPAQLTTHGHDGDRNMKVPWWVDNGAGNLELVGTRLDAAGRFSQVFPMAWSPPGVYPSIVDIPAAGCWLLRLRTGKLAGVLVVRAIDARG